MQQPNRGRDIYGRPFVYSLTLCGASFSIFLGVLVFFIGVSAYAVSPNAGVGAWWAGLITIFTAFFAIAAVRGDINNCMRVCAIILIVISCIITAVSLIVDSAIIGELNSSKYCARRVDTLPIGFHQKNCCDPHNVNVCFGSHGLSSSTCLCCAESLADENKYDVYAFKNVDDCSDLRGRYKSMLGACVAFNVISFLAMLVVSFGLCCCVQVTSHAPPPVAPVVIAAPLGQQQQQQYPIAVASSLAPAQSNNTAQSMGPNNTAQIAPVAYAQSSQPQPSSNDFEVLLNSLSISTNKVNAVNSYFASRGPASPTPDQLGRAVSTEFSLSQGTLAQALAPHCNNITCNHVVAVLRVVSSSARVDVLRAFAPHIIDRENKESIIASAGMLEQEEFARILKA
eukprot:c9027_g1_i2.p1 GENE.c9027_g1_i2~~c9027_g1_i2.p1  ORF type:complete len:398 (+),score=63.47 c9027_g1_i2:33-1226(+)